MKKPSKRERPKFKREELASRVREDLASLAAAAMDEDGGAVLVCMSALATSLSDMSKAVRPKLVLADDSGLSDVLRSFARAQEIGDVASRAADAAWGLQEAVILNSHGDIDSAASAAVQDAAADLESYVERIVEFVERGV